MNAIAIKSLFKRDKSGAKQMLSDIGLEISLDSMNFVQLKRQANGKIGVHDWASVNLPEERKELLFDKAAFKSVVKTALGSSRFKGRKVTAMLPASELKIMSVTYENTRGSSVDAAIAETVAARVEGGLSNYVIDYLPVRQSEDSARGLAIVAFAHAQKVEAFLDVISSAGLYPSALDIGPAAIKRLLVSLHEPGEWETVLAINFGAQVSYLSIISGRRLLFDEEVKFGEEILVNEIAKTLDMDPQTARQQIQDSGLSGSSTSTNNPVEREIAETMREIVRPQFNILADSLKRALIYAVAETRGEPVSRVYILGSVARYSGAAELLQEQIDLPVCVLPDPLALFPGDSNIADSDAQQDHPELALATGLALRDFNLHE